MLRTALCIFAALALAGCGKEVGRVGFTHAGTSTATVPLAAGEVSFWTDIEVEWSGEGTMTYAIDLKQGDNKIATVTCDPFGNIPVKSSWVETNLGGKHTRRGNGKMSCTATVPTAGSTTVTATLTTSLPAASITLTKADLVLKQ